MADIPISAVWVEIRTMDDLPQKKTPGRYEQVDCLVFHKGEIKHLVYNCEHLVWDDAEGDDYYCDPLEPTYYMVWPKPPGVAP